MKLMWCFSENTLLGRKRGGPFSHTCRFTGHKGRLSIIHNQEALWQLFRGCCHWRPLDGWQWSRQRCEWNMCVGSCNYGGDCGAPSAAQSIVAIAQLNCGNYGLCLQTWAIQVTLETAPHLCMFHCWSNSEWMSKGIEHFITENCFFTFRFLQICP